MKKALLTLIFIAGAKAGFTQDWSLSGNNSNNNNFLGSTGNADLIFKTSNAERARFLDGNPSSTAGFLGLGTSTPKALLQLGTLFTFHDGTTMRRIGNNYYYDSGDKRIASGYASAITLNDDGDIGFQTTTTGTAGSSITWTEALWIKNNGTIGFGTSSPDANYLVTFSGNTKMENVTAGNFTLDNLTLSNPISYTGAAAGVVADAWIDGDNSGQLALDASKFTKIGIGCTNPTDALVVKGKISATEVEVKATGAWCDYVFDKSYELMSLAEVSNYIQQNKHLPGIPPANVVEEKGINLGDMSIAQMEKIENLYLYIIELDKKLKEYEAKIIALEMKVCK